jgi:hypothetical protein
VFHFFIINFMLASLARMRPDNQRTKYILCGTQCQRPFQRELERCVWSLRIQSGCYNRWKMDVRRQKIQITRP